MSSFCLPYTYQHKHIDGDIDSMNSKSPSETPFPFRARQGSRPPLHHSHRHILHHNWAARGRPMPPQMHSDATATTPASAPAITQTGTEAEVPYHDHQRHVPSVWRHVHTSIDFRGRRGLWRPCAVEGDTV